MGFLDSLESMAEQRLTGTAGATDTAKVAGGAIEAIDEHPGGLSAILEQFKQNGMGQHLQGWATGEQTTATPEQVQQGLGGTSLIATISQKVGLTPQQTELALAAVLPMLISHFTQGGQAAPPAQGGLTGLASQILGRFI